jgi:hypothetical protein
MYTNLDHFVHAAERLRDLRKRGLLRFHVSPQGSVALAIDPSASDEAPEAGGGLYADLEDAISAAAVGVSLEEFQRARGTPRPNFPEPETPEIAAAKYKQVAPFADELKPRIVFRVTSRAPVLVAHDWAVVSKREDSIVAKDVPNVSYVVLRLTTERSLGVNMGTEREVTTLGLDDQDIEELTSDLGAMRKSLRRWQEDERLSDQQPPDEKAHLT